MEAYVLYKKDAGYENFFANKDLLRSFLFLRTSLMVELLKLQQLVRRVSHPSGPSPLLTPEVIPSIAAADVMLGSLADIRTFWSSLVAFCNEYLRKDTTTCPFVNELKEWVLEMKSFFGLVEEDTNTADAAADAVLHFSTFIDS